MYEWHLPDRVLWIERRPLVMGILNVTPDSFSDGGRYCGVDSAVAHGLELVKAGADVLDIGGESTRPGAAPVPMEEELGRVLPVVKELKKHCSVPLSIDTSKAEVARACLAAGAHIVNDVTALADPAMSEAVRLGQAGIILMHMQGTPPTMQDNPHYDDVLRELGEFFEERLQRTAQIGIARERTVLDPGIGFGKTAEHNLEILARLEQFQRFGRPVCLGVSRKRFLGKLAGRSLEQRLAAGLAVTCFALERQAVQIVRVHDVEPTVDAVTAYARLSELRGQGTEDKA